MNRKRDEYGEDRLARIIQKNHNRSVEDIYEAILRDIKSFMGDMPQQDDMTMIFIKGK